MLAFLHHHPLLTPALGALRQCAWLVILTLIFVPLEQLFAVRRRQISRKPILGDLGFYFISGLLPHLLMAVPLSLAAYAAYHLVPWRVHAAIAAWPIWCNALAAFVLADLGFYWGHRWTHQVPLLWRFHSLHHSPQHVYFLISARAHPVDNVFIRLCGLVPIYVLGLGAPQSVKTALIPTLIMLLTTVWGFFIHANIRWRFGPLEWLFATPAFHHWHHTLGAVRDRNFASMLPCWDWLFGTHHLPRKQWPAEYGIEQALPGSVAGQLIYPFGLLPEAELGTTATAMAGEGSAELLRGSPTASH